MSPSLNKAPQDTTRKRASETVLASAPRWQLVDGGIRTNWYPLPNQLNPPARKLVEELRTLKDGSGLSLAQISTLTHYSRASWERWFNGKRMITPDGLLAFARAVAVDCAHLVALRDQASRAPREVDGATIGGVAPGNEVHAATRQGRRPAGRLAQLPPGIRDFSGRKAETHALATGLTEIRSGPGQVRLAVVSGSGGAGKTALATHVAHLISARFPDGNLYADLRGTDSTPCDPAGVLADWLHALGENEDQIAHSIDARAARFRSLTRDRRLLLLLDDTRDYAQIRPLLPAAETCAVLVTSRSRVASLDGAMRLDLGPMTESDAAATLDRMAGDARLAAEPLATKAILNSCAGHPLALRIAGARLSARPAWRVEALARRLADPRRVLDELALEDVSVRASFEASYTMLDATGQPVSARCAFRLLGLTAGTDISLPMAAALFGIDEAGAEQILETLVDAHLLDAPEAGQYRIHHLIRLCAAERADGDETPAARAAARQRLSQWHATACSEVLGANLLT